MVASSYFGSIDHFNGSGECLFYALRTEEHPNNTEVACLSVQNNQFGFELGRLVSWCVIVEQHRLGWLAHEHTIFVRRYVCTWNNIHAREATLFPYYLYYNSLVCLRLMALYTPPSIHRSVNVMWPWRVGRDRSAPFEQLVFGLAPIQMFIFYSIRLCI